MSRKIAMLLVLLAVSLYATFVWSQAVPAAPAAPGAPAAASQPGAPMQPGMGMGMGHMGGMGGMGRHMGTAASGPSAGGMGCPMMGGPMRCPMMGAPMGPGEAAPFMCPMMGDPIVRMIAMIDQLDSITSSPSKAGLLAIGALKDDIKRKPADVIKDYETLLAKTTSLAMRNAIRLALKDLYKAQGEDEKALDQLRAMVAENEAAVSGPRTK